MICMNKSTIFCSNAQIIAYSGRYHLSPVYQSLKDKTVICNGILKNDLIEGTI